MKIMKMSAALLPAEKMKFLSELMVFQDLTSREMEELNRITTMSTVRKGRVFYRPEEPGEVALGAEAQIRCDVVDGAQPRSELAHRLLHAQHVPEHARGQGGAAAEQVEEVLAGQPHGARKGLEPQAFADAGLHELD